MRYTSSIFFTLFVLINTVSAQLAEYEYYTELCYCRGKFDSTKIARHELDNALNHLWFDSYSMPHPNVHTPADIPPDNFKKLKEQCGKALSLLDTLRVPEVPYWQDRKLRQIREIEDMCQLSEFSILAYENPDTLLYYPELPDTCRYWVDALIDGDELMLLAWEELTRRLMLSNASPERLESEFIEKYNSHQRYEWARIQIMKYGWWNSANDFIPHITDYCGDEFAKLFNELDCSECDEP